MRQQLKYKESIGGTVTAAPRDTEHGRRYKARSKRLSMASDELRASRNLACPERFKPSNSLASGGSTFRGFPGPLRFSSGEVIGGSQDPDLRLFQYPCQKGLVICQPLGEILAGQDGWVDRSAKRIAGVLGTVRIFVFEADAHEFAL